MAGIARLSVVMDIDSVSCWVVPMVVSVNALSLTRVHDLLENVVLYKPYLSSSW